MKKFLSSVAGASTVFIALVMFCSNPEKDVKWRTSIDLPVTSNQKFYLGAMMDTLFFNKKQMLTDSVFDTLKQAGHPDSVIGRIETTMTEIHAYPDTAKGKKIPDTVAFGFPAHDTASDTISEDSLADKYFEDVFGPIPIANTAANSVTVPLIGNYTAATPAATPPVPLSVKYVYQIVLDTAQTLSVAIANNSTADFSSVSVNLGALGTSTIANLAHNAIGTASFDVGGKEIDSIVTVSITVTPAASGAFAAGDNMGASFSMNGLKATKVVVMDSLLKDYYRTFTNEYDLTDTVNVDYIDIDKGFFIYSVTNYTGLDLLLSVTHRHLWRSDFCQGHTPPLIKLSDLVGLTYDDSLSASNSDIAVREQFPANQTNTYSKHNISANRLFAQWNPAKKKSTTMVDYQVNIGAFGRRVTLAASDSLQFVIKTTSFKFKEMFGVSTEQYRRTSEPSNIPVTLPWNRTVTDSLRDNFILQNVMAKSTMRINLPPDAFIDTMHMHYVISSVTHPGVACSSDVVLLHVTQDSVYHRPINITNVVNDYPDSVKVAVVLTIPAGTALKAVNDLTNPSDPSYTKYIGRMKIKGVVDYNLVAAMCWTVADTTVMDLGGSRVDLGDANGVLDPLSRMTDKHASLNVRATNFTNVYMRLFALAATDTALIGPFTDTTNPAYVTTNQFSRFLVAPPPGFVNLLDGGLLIPPRDSTHAVFDTIPLTDQQLSQLLKAKAIGWRWLVRFIPQKTGGIAPDALYNTDWIKLNSWIHIDGVNCVDSLF